MGYMQKLITKLTLKWIKLSIIIWKKKKEAGENQPLAI